MNPDLLRQLFPSGRSWMADARCIDADPDAFFVEVGGQVAAAKEICDLCPVSDDCADYALRHRLRHGVWGGTTPNERRAVEPPEELKPCGTNAAYRRHQKAGEAPCGPCREAHNAYKVRRDRVTA